MYDEAMDNEAQEDAAIEEFEADGDVINISSDEDSQEDDEGPPVEFDDDEGHKESWIWRPKD